ncbi:hypothetical protein TRFO_40247 [Tritrichomonas foetus]|uniref:Uncharacterized protein n=1 Tax=Tritrichomonas foetus TaxID=1144522 RepID=A0A1J4J267_9EUKA|nr:hypothetical protein TRFO_40247 [Tritrichomonas foetus]|eukprot:OHS93474.1 hypothetical protein TRFO_40247 [Tritrichomonas foetus]
MAAPIDLAVDKFGPLDQDITYFTNELFNGRHWFSHVIKKTDNELVWVVRYLEFPEYIRKFNIFGDCSQYIGFSSMMNDHDENHNDVIFEKTTFHGTNYYVLLFDNPIVFPTDNQVFAYDAVQFEREVRNYRIRPTFQQKYTADCPIITDFMFPGKTTGFYFPKIPKYIPSPSLRDRFKTREILSRFTPGEKISQSDFSNTEIAIFCNNCESPIPHKLTKKETKKVDKMRKAKANKRKPRSERKPLSSSDSSSLSDDDTPSDDDRKPSHVSFPGISSQSQKSQPKSILKQYKSLE